jgi:dsRNA-specific ribonuclease
MCFAFESIARAAIIHASLQFSHHCFFNYVDVWHHALDHVCNYDFKSNIYIPLRHIVSKRSIESFPEFLRLVFTHVSVHNENNETSVKELTNESTFDYRCFLLTNGIFSYPCD